MYVFQVMEELNISPGSHLEKYAAAAQKKRKRQSELSELPATKRQRLIRKGERAMCEEVAEVTEGATYESGNQAEKLISFHIYGQVLSPP